MANKTKLPFEGLRVVELDAYLISGRLTGMLFADQGAEGAAQSARCDGWS